jgi:Zn-dependent peptidase ImmA (M78 family)
MKSRANPWAEPLVSRLIAQHRGQDPEQIIEAFAEKLLAKAGQTSLPINIEGIASLEGIRTRVKQFDFVGRIYAEESGQLVMDLNANDPKPRRRFTAAHELIHTAFPGFRRDARYRVDDHIGAHQRNRAQEEYLCDLGAAALLMPKRLVAGQYGLQDGLAGVERLAERAEVSLEAAGNRIVALADEPAAFLVLEVMHKPADLRALRKDASVPKRLRVRYAACSSPALYIPRFKSADEGSAFERALGTLGTVRAVEHLPGDDSGRKFVVEAKAFPHHRAQEPVRRVLALAVSTGPSNAAR